MLELAAFGLALAEQLERGAHAVGDGTDGGGERGIVGRAIGHVAGCRGADRPGQAVARAAFHDQSGQDQRQAERAEQRSD